METLSKLPPPARPRVVNMLLMISPFVHNFHIISLFVDIHLLFAPCVLGWRSPCEIDMSVIKRGEGEWENLLSEGTLLVGGCWNLPAMSTPTHPTQLHTCDIREDRKCTQYLTIQLNTTWFFNYPKVGNNLSVPRAMLQLIKQSVVDVVKTSGVSHVWIFTHMSTVHFLLRQKRVYTTSSIFDVQPAHFQLLCLHLVPMLIIMRGLKITFKWYFLFW